MQVRCPHCHSPLEILESDSLSDIPCPSCGSSFSLIKDVATTVYQPTAQKIAHFELHEKLGVGAFGTVWKAQDTELDRTVAIKVPRKGQLDAEETEKFFREARAAAQLRHPNIVSVHEVGRDGDTVYIVSDLVDGLSLSDWLSGQQVTTREAARLCAKIAEALEHAHQQGVIHRDLKPSNIMLDAESEPHIMDFGLAKREVGEITMTVEGQILGTPAYMSPEQAKGESHQGDRRSDIYSLGVILFELLTGELPFRGNKRMLLHQVIHEEPPSPRKLNGIVPRDLETICLKCLEKEPRRRFETAQELADELQRFLTRKPILSRPITRIERGFRWCRRKPIIAGLLATVSALLLFLATAGVLVSIQQAKLRKNAEDETTRAIASEKAEAEARVAAEEAESEAQLENDRARIHAIAAGAAKDEVVVSRDVLRRNLYFADLNLAHQALIDADFERVDQLLTKHMPAEGETDLRGFEWFYLRHATRREDLAVQARGHVACARYTVDGKLVAVACDRHIDMFDAATMLPRFSLSTSLQEQPIDRFVLSKDGRFLATAAKNGLVVCWSLADREAKWSKQFPRFQCFALSPNGQRLAIGRERREDSGATLIVDTATGEIASKIEANVPNTFSVVYLSDNRLVTSLPQARVVCWNPETAEVVWKTPQIAAYHDYAWALDCSPDGKRLAGVFQDNSVRVFDAETGDELARVLDHRDLGRDVAYSPDGQYIATSANDPTIKIRDAETAKPLATIRVSQGSPSVSFSPDGEYLVSAPLKRWRMSEVLGDAFQIENSHWASSLAVSSDGRRFAMWEYGTLGHMIVVGSLDDPRTRKTIFKAPARLQFRQTGDGDELVLFSLDRKLMRIDSETGELLATIESGHAENPTALDVSTDGALAATATNDKTIRIWDLENDSLLRTLEGFEGSAIALRFVQDSSELLSLHQDGSILRWNLETGESQPLTEFRTTLHHDNQGVFSVDGKFAAFTPSKSIVTLDVESGEVLSTCDGHAARPNQLCFLADGRTLASGSWDRTIRLWDIETGQLRMIFRDHTAGVNSLAVTPDGDMLLSAARDRTVRLWRAELQPTVSQPVRGAVYSPDGSKIATVANYSVDGDGSEKKTTVRIWDAADRQLLHVLELNEETASAVAAFPPMVFSSDARHLFAASDNTIRMWDVATGQLVKIFRGHREPPSYLCLTADGTTLISTGRNTLRLASWDIGTGQSKDHSSLDTSRGGGKVAISPDQTSLAHLQFDGVVRLVDLATWTIKQEWASSLMRARYIGWPAANRVVVAGSEGIDVYDLESQKPIAHFEGEIQRCTATPDGRTIACKLAGGSTILLEANSDGIQQVHGWQLFEPHEELAISPDGAEVIHATENGEVILWSATHGTGIGRLAAKGNLAHFQSLTTSKPAAAANEARKPFYFEKEKPYAFEPADLFEMTRHSRAMCVAFSPRDPALLAASIDSDIHLWNTETGELLNTFKGHDFQIKAMAFSPDGDLLATGGHDRRIMIWDVESGQRVANLPTDRVICDLTFLPDGQTLLCGQNFNPSQIQFWDLQTRLIRKTILTGQRSNFKIELLPQQNLFATRHGGGQPVQFWDMTTGESRELPEPLHLLDKRTKLIAFSPDGSLMAHTVNGSQIQLWGFARQRILHRDALRLAGPLCMAFSPNGDAIAVGDTYGGIAVFDVQEGRIRQTRPMKHVLRVNSVAFSDDGKTLATSGWEGIVKLWDPRTGELFRRLDQAQAPAEFATEQLIDEKQAAEKAAPSPVKVPTEEATRNENGQQPGNASVNPEEIK